MTDDIVPAPIQHIRVWQGQRHLFYNLEARSVITPCNATVITAELADDDPTVKTCSLCALFIVSDT